MSPLKSESTQELTTECESSVLSDYSFEMPDRLGLLEELNSWSTRL